MTLQLVSLRDCHHLTLRHVNEALLDFWSPYMARKMSLDIPINDTLSITLEPYYGIIFNEADVIGQNFAIDLDFGSEEPVTLYIPNNILNLILGNFLDPLLPEHFDSQFLCNILEIILVDTLMAIKQKTGIMPKFHSFAGVKGDFKSFWRLYVNDDKDIFYPMIIGGEQRIVDDLLKKLFAKRTYQKSASPLIPLKIVSVVRKMRLSQLKNLKIGEIIILLTKRHPINEPLVIISDKIVCHTTLDDMELHLTQDPRLLEDTEELKMTIDDDDIDAVPENQSEEFDDNPHENNNDNAHHSINTALNDLKVTVTFELNRMELSTQAISHLREGSVLNLQKQITEDIYLTVSGRTIAVGEVVQVGRNFGVLIKEIL